ncbi:MAG: hypothetical protein EBV84_08280 [Betaproteobacteria bacterium]|nr:hypothetical protein [Betaproteobacteria bacterium]
MGRNRKAHTQCIKRGQHAGGIEQTVREKLPEGFQRAEFLLEKGAVDMILDRRQLRETIARLVALLMRQSSDAVVIGSSA